MNWYKHYIGDFARDTGHLSLTERGAYRALLDHHYATERPLPDNTAALARMVGAVTKAEREAVAAILREFWELTSDGWINGRALKEMAKAGHQRDVNRSITAAREAKRNAGQSAEDGLTNEATNRATNRYTNAQPNQTPDTRLKQAKLNGDGEIEAKAVSLVELGDACLEAIGHDPARFIGSYSGLQGLLNAGFPAEQILATAKRLGQRDGFTAPRNPMAWLAKVLPGEIGSAAEPEAKPLSDDERWDHRLKAYRDKRVWMDAWGPPPDDPYGRKPDAPERLLAKHGYRQENAA